MAPFAEVLITSSYRSGSGILLLALNLQQMSGYGHSRLLVKTNTSIEMARSVGLLVKANMVIKKKIASCRPVWKTYTSENVLLFTLQDTWQSNILMTHPANKL